MTSLSGVVEQLKKERDRVEKQLSALNAALTAFAGVYVNGSGSTPGKRTMSPEARRRISLAQKARWARVATKTVTPKPKKTRVTSAEARRKIAAAQKARWAKVRSKKAA